MGLLFRPDDGTSTFLPDQARMDLITIAEMDAGVGEDPARADGMIPVTYTRDPSFTDEPPVRLDDLCNQTFNGPSPLPSGVPAPPVTPLEFQIWPVVSSFLIPGSTSLITTAAGVAFSWDTAGNPISQLLCVYDAGSCNGSGYFVKDEDGNDIDEPLTVILYHELAHLHDDATTGTTSEPSAETQENDMRDFLGLPHRDPNSHDGGCGGGSTSCCVVASLATTSPFSSEVKALRRVRDRLLRRTEIGFDLFSRLHEQYYRVSSRVCRSMAHSAEFRELVRTAFVNPLVMMLEILWRRRQRGFQLAGEFRQRVAAQPQLMSLTSEQRADAQAVLQGALPSGKVDGDGLAWILRSAAVEDAVLRWCLIAPIEIALSGLNWLDQGLDERSLARRLATRLHRWSAGLPLTPVWRDLSPSERQRERADLHATLLLSPSARRRFDQRLAAYLSEAA